MVGTVQSDDELAETSPNNQSETPLGSEGPAGEQVEMLLPSDFSGFFKAVYSCWRSWPPFMRRGRSSCPLSLPPSSSFSCSRP